MSAPPDSPLPRQGEGPLREGPEGADPLELIAGHAGGPLLVCGSAGSGRTEALARRHARLAASRYGPEGPLTLTRSRSAAMTLRRRVEEILGEPREELWIGTFAEIAERLLRDYAVEGGLDPFFATVSAPDRLAMMLDRLDELPLRRHAIRGNPAGLLGRLLRRIDALKVEAVRPERLREWASAAERGAEDPASRQAAHREAEFCELYVRHDRILREAGALDEGDLVLELGRLLGALPDVRDAVARRFERLCVDELEETGVAHRGLLDLLAPHGDLACAADPAQSVRRLRGAGAAAVEAFRAAHPGLKEVGLHGSRRFGDAIERAAGAILGRTPSRPADAGAAGRPAEAGEASGGVRFWRCLGERAQAQAVAREVEHLLAAGDVRPEAIGIVAASGWREGRLVAAALEERSVPFRFAGDAAFFQRPEVRDTLAWLRSLADPADTAAVVRAVTRPPVELPSADLARCTLIARRRKLDMVSALEAALESPQLRPEARDRIGGFMKLYRAAGGALDEMPADVFVRRLVERVGLRRQRLFAASPQTAERLVNLSRLAELAAEWARREPRGATRDFVRHITAVADAADLGSEDPGLPRPGGVVVAEPAQLKGLELELVYVLGLGQGSLAVPPGSDRWVPGELIGERLPQPGPELAATRRAQLAHLAATRARRSLVLSWVSEEAGVSAPAPAYAAARESLGGEEEVHSEELFGPAEGLHSTYRMIRDEVLETSWRAGSALSEMRLDTAEDVNRAVARFLELIKLAAMVQRPEDEPAREAISAVNDLLGRIASPEQLAELQASALDEHLLDTERERRDRRELVAARREPSLEEFLPRRGEGLALSATDIDLYRTCPLKYKFARVFAIPQEPTINQRFGIVVHQVLERFHAEEMRAGGEGGEPGSAPEGSAGAEAGSLDRLLALFEAAWRRQGFGTSDDELQFRDRAVAALSRYQERHVSSSSQPVWLERSFAFAIGAHQLRGRVDRVDRLPEGGFELIDYKTGERSVSGTPSDDVQLGLYRLGARQAWDLESTRGAYWYVLDDERVPVEPRPDDAERVERTVLEVAAGIEGQDFEPRPSYEICSWCDYRLICPASEA